MKNVFVIYHSADFDGLFCREIAKRTLGSTAEYIGWDYGQPAPTIGAEVSLIYMLDISIETMMDDRRLIWIDHHKSAIDKFPSTIQGYRIDGVAACRLAWQWFNKPNPVPIQIEPPVYDLPKKQAFVDRDVSEPYAVRLAGEYDIWDKRDPQAELFQHGLRSQDIGAVWPELLNPTGTIGEEACQHLLRKGAVLQYARQKEDESIIKSNGFVVEFEGLTFLACNAARYNSHLFTAGLTGNFDGCLGFNFDGKKWKVSLYGVPGKPDIDFSKIAIKYGGGGHKQACGFEVAKLPFLN